MPLADEALNYFLASLERLNENASNAGWETAGQVVENIRSRAVVDTGAMRDSVYRVGDGKSTYGDAVGAARGDMPDVVILSTEEAKQSKEIHEVLVGVAAEHGFFVENGYGPQGRRPPKPFFEPGLDGAEDIYMEELTRHE